MEADEYGVPLLPLDLVEPIANRLLTHDVVDYISFRAVCRDWRCHTASPTSFASKFRPRNWIMLPYFGNNPSSTPGSFLNLSIGRSLVLNNLPELQSYSVVSACDGLLVLLDKGTLTMRIFNPFTRQMSDNLPPLESRFGFTVQMYSDYERLWRYSFIMIDDDSPCLVLMVCLLCGSIYFAKPNDTRWTYIECDYMNVTTNAFFQGKFYYINMEDEICAVDPEQGLNSPLIPLHYEVGDSSSVLVKFNSDLLLIRWIGEFVPETFEVFRVDLESKILTRLDSLGEHAIISGVNRHTIVIPTKSFPSIKGNSIYCFLLDISNSIYYAAMPSHAQSVTYSLHDQSIELLSDFHDGDSDSLQPRSLVDYLFKYCSFPRW